MAKKTTPPPIIIPPPPFQRGQAVTLSPQLLARYPLWHPTGPFIVERVVPQLMKDGSLELWAVWTRVGDNVHLLPHKDVLPA